jgi:hypothetical protein
MTHLVALHTTNRKPTDGPVTKVDGYDLNGTPNVRAIVEVIKPGDIFFEGDATEAQWFIDQEAARELQPHEEAALKQFGDGATK